MNTNYINCPSANAQKMALFSKASSDYWTSEAFGNFVYTMDRLKLTMVKESLIKAQLAKKEFANTSTPFKGLAVLDVGCGGGLMCEPLAELGCQVVGIDICFDMIEVAKQHATQNPCLSNLTYSYESVEEHSKNNREKYDVILVSEVLIHTNDQNLFLKDTLSCLKPGGLIYISNCNKTWGAWLVGVVLGEYILKLLPRGIYSWNRHKNPEELAKMLLKYNCETKEVRGMFYNPFSEEWFWTEYTFLYYSVYAIKEAK